MLTCHVDDIGNPASSYNWNVEPNSQDQLWNCNAESNDFKCEVENDCLTKIECSASNIIGRGEKAEESFSVTGRPIRIKNYFNAALFWHVLMCTFMIQDMCL